MPVDVRLPAVGREAVEDAEVRPAESGPSSDEEDGDDAAMAAAQVQCSAPRVSNCTAMHSMTTIEPATCVVQEPYVSPLTLMCRVAGTEVQRQEPHLASCQQAQAEAAAQAPEPAAKPYESTSGAGAPAPLAPHLVTLSLLPRTQWHNLVHLDAIRARSKPIAPPKKPAAAPFFLPTVAGGAWRECPGAVLSSAPEAAHRWHHQKRHWTASFLCPAAGARPVTASFPWDAPAAPWLLRRHAQLRP